MKLSRYALTFSYALAASTYADSQTPQHFTVRDGLPSNHVYEVQEDDRGYVWLATNRGLVRYDGADFRTFTVQDGLPNNDVWELYAGRGGRLWFFSRSNRHGFIKHDSIYTFPTDKGASIHPLPYLENAQGFWLANGMYRFTGTDFAYDASRGKVLHPDRGRDFVEKMKRTHGPGWYIRYSPPAAPDFVLSGGRVFFMDEKGNVARVVENPKITLRSSSGYFTTLSEDGICALSDNKAVIFIDSRNEQVTSVLLRDFGLTNQQPSFRIKTKFNGNNWQLAFPGGLLILDKQLRLVEKYTFPETLGTIGAFRDSRGNVWAASFKNGLYLYTAAQNVTEYYLAGKKINAIGQAANRIIAASETDGNFWYHPASDDYRTLTEYPDRGKPYRIFTQDGKGYLVNARGITRYDGKTFEDIYSTGRKPREVGGKDLLVKGDTLFKVGPRYFWMRHGDTYREIRKQGLMTLAEYRNTVYTGGSDGLFIVEGERFRRLPFADTTLLTTPVRALAATDRALWVGTDGRGIYAVSDTGLCHVTATENLSIIAIVPQQDTLWLATGNGLKKLVLNDHLPAPEITNTYHEADGLLLDNLNDLYLADGAIYAATDAGISKIFPQSAVYRQKPRLNFAQGRDTLTVLADSSRNIDVDFHAIHYGHQHLLRYRYRLLPQDTAWQATNTQTLHFSGLKPDTYTLEVAATDQHGNESRRALTIRVQPKWWETELAKFVFFAIGILLLPACIGLVVNFYRRKERKRLDTVQQMKQLELQALRAQMNPHFVHNSLNAIQYFIQRHEVELSENYLTKFSKLIRQFFEYSRRQTISLEEEITLLDNYLQIEKLRFEEKVSYTIRVDPALDTADQQIPTMILQPIIENAVNHGLFHKKDNGNIKIAFEQRDQSAFEVTIEDDGIGINRAQQIHNQSAKNYRSHSGALLEERLRLLKESKQWNVTYRIIDRSVDRPDETGTRVTLTFKQGT